MTARSISFKIIQDIAADLSGDKVSFPTFLNITFQIRNALKDPNVSLDALAKLVSLEPLMSAKVIHIANSAAMNPSGRAITDVKTAMNRIGMEALRSVSFAVALEQLTQSRVMLPFNQMSKRLWNHSTHVAAVCRLLARKVARINPDEAMFTGLVHDLGVFYLLSRAATFPELCADKAELHALLIDWHEQIGHSLLSALGQSEAVLEAVQQHETPRKITALNNLTDVLYIANQIANLDGTWHEPGYEGTPDTSAIADVFDGDALKEILAEAEEEVHSLKAALGGQ